MDEKEKRLSDPTTSYIYIIVKLHKVKIDKYQVILILIKIEYSTYYKKYPGRISWM